LITINKKGFLLLANILAGNSVDANWLSAVLFLQANEEASPSNGGASVSLQHAQQHIAVLEVELFLSLPLSLLWW